MGLFFVLFFTTNLIKKALSFPCNNIMKPYIQNTRKGSGSSDGTTPSVDSHGDDTMPERKGRDEEFEQLLEKYNVDEIEAKPKNFYSHVCNRWVSLSGVRNAFSMILNQFMLK